MEPSQQPQSLWQLKPWWCQPWSIVLTGLAVPTVSWVWLHRWWITTPATLVILAWWYLFLYLVPKEFNASQSDL